MNAYSLGRIHPVHKPTTDLSSSVHHLQHIPIRKLMVFPEWRLVFKHDRSFKIRQPPSRELYILFFIMPDLYWMNGGSLQCNKALIRQLTLEKKSRRSKTGCMGASWPWLQLNTVQSSGGLSLHVRFAYLLNQTSRTLQLQFTVTNLNFPVSRVLKHRLKPIGKYC